MAFEATRNEALARSSQHEIKSDRNDTSVVLHLERNTSRKTAPADQIDVHAAPRKRRKLDASTIDLFSDIAEECLDHAEELAIATTDVRDGEVSEQGDARQPTLLMPCHSGFLLTDLLKSQLTLPSGFPEALQFLHTKQLSLLLLDPPYPNASVARASKRNKHKEAYSPVQDLYDLWKLKDCVARLLRAGSAERSLAQNTGLDSHYAKERATLVACWVTNDPKARHLMLGKLFRSWDVVPIGEIGWLKVTASSASGDTGSPASGTNRRFPSNDLASSQDDNACVSQGGQLVISPELALQTGRKSHEVLLLGRYIGAADSQSVEARARRMELARAEARECAQRRTVIVSVPLGHSRKPYVFDVLRPLLPPHRHQDSPVVVELFARNLCAGPVGRADVHESIDGVELLNAVSEPDVNTKGRATDQLRPGAQAAVPSGTVQSRSLQRGWWISIGNEAPRFNIVGAGSPGLSRTAL
ncbi:DROSOPHILA MELANOGASTER BITHORAX COMPLEX (BX-C)-RELATED [Ceraceosorus bombacis]|uniref:DROSOPHILA MELANOGASTER BITHORAX COMPLEX (BX-C)-RELATED n=1 Tax=Ceraceosorus bombacis TaxID=401625 RepID=A0A0N7LA29_9BASI|nr:DROSOPHILA MELANOGASTER BITHORAX COMPLEX (BX-C)-RELATED [Ceraceosorus bombacis]